MNMERYSRQILFPHIGKEGQEKIRQKHVLIIGAGALGSSIAEMLVRAGVGKLTIVDRDYVEFSNLQRQQLYTERDVEARMPKAEAAKLRLSEINSEVSITAVVTDATPQKMEEWASKADLIMDATDNFETRMVINDLSQKYQKPWIYGACVGSTGMSFTIIPGVTPCLNCLLKSVPIQGLTCDTGGIISPAVQMAVSHQVAEAMKILVEDYDAVRTTLIFFDLWQNQYQAIKVGKAKKDDCLSCGQHPTYPFLEADNATKTTVLCGRDTVQVRPPRSMEVDFESLAGQLRQSGYEVQANPFLLSVQWGEDRMVIFKDGRALIHGTKDMSHAKSLYQKVMG